MARTPDKLIVSDGDKEALKLLHSHKVSKALATRAKIILKYSYRESLDAIFSSTGVLIRTLFEWRGRCYASGLDELKDRLRSRQPTKLTEVKINQALWLMTERVQREATFWSVRLMSKYLNLTTWQVRRVWEMANLKPYCLKTFKTSTNNKFTEKVMDIVGLNLISPDNTMVLSADEKPQIQALGQTQPMLPLKPCIAEFDMATGQAIGRVTQRHRAKEFPPFCRQTDCSTPPELDLHLILDISICHNTGKVQKWLTARTCIKVIFTPTSASRLNIVENWFSSLVQQHLHRGVFCNVKAL